MADIIVNWDSTEIDEQIVNGYGIRVKTSHIDKREHYLYKEGDVNRIIMSDTDRCKSWYSPLLQPILADGTPDKVLIIGLGIGMVERALLSMKPEITEIISVEIQQGVKDLMLPLITDNRHTIVVQDGKVYSTADANIKYVIIDIWSDVGNSNVYKSERSTEIARYQAMLPSATVLALDLMDK